MNRETYERNKRKTPKRIIALAVAFTFLSQQINFLYAFVPVETNVAISNFKEPQIEIPQGLGSIEQTISPKQNAPIVVHIQNAHGNYEAQKNIQAILDYLTAKENFKALFLEGGKGKLHPEVFQLFPNDPDLNLKLADSLAQKAELTGPELFLIDSFLQKGKSTTINGYGLEHASAYRTNRKAFQAVLRAKEKSEGFLQDMDLQIERLTSPYLNASLKNFLRRFEDYETQKEDLNTWLTFLKNEAKKHLEINLEDPFYQKDWPMLIRFFRLQAIEPSLDRALIDKEKKEFLTKLKSLHIKKHLIEKVDAILNFPMDRTNALSQAQYLETLQTFGDLLEALPNDFSFKPYEHLRLYVQSMILESELKGELLFHEIDSLEALISGTLARTDTEKKLLDLFKDYRLLKKLFTLELTRKDYETILERKTIVRPSEIAKSFKAINHDKRVRNIQFNHLGEVDQLFDLALSFYKGANRRDSLMASHMLRKMQKEKLKKAVLVTGGFHSEGMKHYFEKKGFSYFLITPKITQIGDGKAYHMAMLEENNKVSTSQIENVNKIEFPAILDQLAGKGYANYNGKLMKQALFALPKRSISELSNKIDTGLLANQYGIKPSAAPSEVLTKTPQRRIEARSRLSPEPKKREVVSRAEVRGIREQLQKIGKQINEHFNNLVQIAISPFTTMGSWLSTMWKNEPVKTKRSTRLLNIEGLETRLAPVVDNPFKAAIIQTMSSTPTPAIQIDYGSVLSESAATSPTSQTGYPVGAGAAYTMRTQMYNAQIQIENQGLLLSNSHALQSVSTAPPVPSGWTQTNNPNYAYRVVENPEASGIKTLELLNIENQFSYDVASTASQNNFIQVNVSQSRPSGAETFLSYNLVGPQGNNIGGSYEAVLQRSALTPSTSNPNFEFATKIVGGYGLQLYLLSPHPENSPIRNASLLAFASIESFGDHVFDVRDVNPKGTFVAFSIVQSSARVQSINNPNQGITVPVEYGLAPGGITWTTVAGHEAVTLKSLAQKTQTIDLRLIGLPAGIIPAASNPNYGFLHYSVNTYSLRLDLVNLNTGERQLLTTASQESVSDISKVHDVSPNGEFVAFSTTNTSAQIQRVDNPNVKSVINLGNHYGLQGIEWSGETVILIAKDQSRTTVNLNTVGVPQGWTRTTSNPNFAYRVVSDVHPNYKTLEVLNISEQFSYEVASILAGGNFTQVDVTANGETLIYDIGYTSPVSAIPGLSVNEPILKKSSFVPSVSNPENFSFATKASSTIGGPRLLLYLYNNQTKHASILATAYTPPYGNDVFNSKDVSPSGEFVAFSSVAPTGSFGPRTQIQRVDNPTIGILVNPSNGLSPNGIQWTALPSGAPAVVLTSNDQSKIIVNLNTMTEVPTAPEVLSVPQTGKELSFLYTTTNPVTGQPLALSNIYLVIHDVATGQNTYKTVASGESFGPNSFNLSNIQVSPNGESVLIKTGSTYSIIINIKEAAQPQKRVSLPNQAPNNGLVSESFLDNNTIEFVISQISATGAPLPNKSYLVFINSLSNPYLTQPDVVPLQQIQFFNASVLAPRTSLEISPTGTNANEITAIPALVHVSADQLQNARAARENSQTQVNSLKANKILIKAVTSEEGGGVAADNFTTQTIETSNLTNAFPNNELVIGVSGTSSTARLEMVSVNKETGEERKASILLIGIRPDVLQTYRISLQVFENQRVDLTNFRILYLINRTDVPGNYLLHTIPPANLPVLAANNNLTANDITPMQAAAQITGGALVPGDTNLYWMNLENERRNFTQLLNQTFVFGLSSSSPTIASNDVIVTFFDNDRNAPVSFRLSGYGNEQKIYSITVAELAARGLNPEHMQSVYVATLPTTVASLLNAEGRYNPAKVVIRTDPPFTTVVVTPSSQVSPNGRYRVTPETPSIPQSQLVITDLETNLTQIFIQDWGTQVYFNRGRVDFTVTNEGVYIIKGVELQFNVIDHYDIRFLSFNNLPPVPNQPGVGVEANAVLVPLSGISLKATDVSAISLEHGTSILRITRPDGTIQRIDLTTWDVKQYDVTTGAEINPLTPAASNPNYGFLHYAVNTYSLRLDLVNLNTGERQLLTTASQESVADISKVHDVSPNGKYVVYENPRGQVTIQEVANPDHKLSVKVEYGLAPNGGITWTTVNGHEAVILKSNAQKTQTIDLTTLAQVSQQPVSQPLPGTVTSGNNTFSYEIKTVDTVFGQRQTLTLYHRTSSGQITSQVLVPAEQAGVSPIGNFAGIEPFVNVSSEGNLVVYGYTKGISNGLSSRFESTINIQRVGEATPSFSQNLGRLQATPQFTATEVILTTSNGSFQINRQTLQQETVPQATQQPQANSSVPTETAAIDKLFSTATPSIDDIDKIFSNPSEEFNPLWLLLLAGVQGDKKQLQALRSELRKNVALAKFLSGIIPLAVSPAVLGEAVFTIMFHDHLMAEQKAHEREAGIGPSAVEEFMSRAPELIRQSIGTGKFDKVTPRKTYAAIFASQNAAPFFNLAPGAKKIVALVRGPRAEVKVYLKAIGHMNRILAKEGLPKIEVVKSPRRLQQAVSSLKKGGYRESDIIGRYLTKIEAALLKERDVKQLSMIEKRELESPAASQLRDLFNAMLRELKIKISA